MITYSLVGLGAGFGALLRYQITNIFKKKTIGYYGTFLINILGSFLLGLFFATCSTNLYSLLGTGFCGGFTTYSTFNNELSNLFYEKKTKRLFIYWSLSYLFGILLGIIGWLIGTKTI
ncbi:hypothetical protein GSH19_03980 [Lactobacillus sp. S2-2]|uniref:fluoride efflux transporter FluC n=1 Tax=Lactobacillus sp. S2-2 TaxID=2692917 RepID=UPI001F44D8FD|nr:CrcB family protein [Lactobacillus sp. S2-2]MCF6515313.1 hypothetical protein [Lactobacillus sp. S2-2]